MNAPNGEKQCIHGMPWRSPLIYDDERGGNRLWKGTGKTHVDVRKEQNMRDTMLETPRKRPVGVTIIAGLLWIEAVLGISIGVITMIGGLGGVLSFLGIVATVFGLIELYVAWGLWTLQRWAFWTAVIIEALALAGGAVSLFQPGANVGATVSTMVLPVVILLYFLLAPASVLHSVCDDRAILTASSHLAAWYRVSNDHV